MVKNFKKITIILAIFASIIITGSAIFWWKGVNELSYSSGRLNISKIADDNRLKVIQMDIDFFIDVVSHDGGKYTAIMPFSVQSGFDIEKIKIVHEKGDKETNIIKITLPEPRILNVDSSDSGRIVTLREKHSEHIFVLVKSYKIFGEQYVRHIALARDILVETNREVEQTLTSFVKNSFPDAIVDIETEPISEKIKTVEYHSDTIPVYFALYDRDANSLLLNSNNRDKGFFDIGHYCYVGRTSDNSVSFHLTKSGKASDLESLIEKWRNLDVDFGRLFSPLNPNLRIYTYQKDDRSIFFLFLFKGYAYEFTVKAEDKYSLDKNLPKILPVVLSLKVDENFEEPRCVDDYGMQKEAWTDISIDNKREYFFSLAENFMRQSPNTIKHVKHNEGYQIYYDFEEKENSEGIYKNVREIIKALKNDDSVHLKNLGLNSFEQHVLALFCNFNKVHRNRYVFFMEEGLLFYIPERTFWGKGQSSIYGYYPYSDVFLNDGEKISFENEKVVFENKVDNERAIQSKALSQFVAWLVNEENKTFVDLYKCSL